MPLFTVKRPSVYLHADVILIWLWLLRQLLFVITSKCCAVKSKSRKYQFQVLVCPGWKSNPCMMFYAAVLKIYVVIVGLLSLTYLSFKVESDTLGLGFLLLFTIFLDSLQEIQSAVWVLDVLNSYIDSLG